MPKPGSATAGAKDPLKVYALPPYTSSRYEPCYLSEHKHCGQGFRHHAKHTREDVRKRKLNRVVRRIGWCSPYTCFPSYPDSLVHVFISAAPTFSGRGLICRAANPSLPTLFCAHPLPLVGLDFLPRSPASGPPAAPERGRSPRSRHVVFLRPGFHGAGGRGGSRRPLARCSRCC